MSISMRKKLALSGVALAFVVVLLAILFMSSKKDILSSGQPYYPIPIWFIILSPEFEAEVQEKLLELAHASGEEYIALRDALIPHARAKPEAFRFVAAISPSWEQRLAGEIIMDYALREDGVRMFIEWDKKRTPIEGRDWRDRFEVPGRDLAERARGAPMVLAEIIWKGTYEELDFRNTQVIAALALGNLRERRARELLEWLMLDISEKYKDGRIPGSYILIAESLGEIGAPESMPVLLSAIEKLGKEHFHFYADPIMKCADMSNLPLLMDVANNSTNEDVVAVARAVIARILEARQGE